MKQKILLTIDGLELSEKAVDYVTKVINSEDEITLYNVLPRPSAVCELDEPSLTPLFKKHQKAFCALEDSKRDIIKDFMEKAKKKIMKTGISSDNLVIKVENQTENVENHIIREATNGGYDTIILGKKGSSKLNDIILGSISHKILQLAKDIAVTIIT
ncbi:MAG: universal stress protein [Spirochaetota bacterium]|nr:universal stress protein [Spirochaetota bacterium]